MIVSSGAMLQGNRVRRYAQQVPLAAALLELLRAYDGLGSLSPQTTAYLDGEIERCLNGQGLPRDRIQSHLHKLLRARDLHRYLVEDEALAALKLRLCEHLLYHRTGEERWAAVRELLVAHIDAICAVPMPGMAANLERYKQALSDRASPLGKLLVATALFNLDQSDEAPPANLLLQFRRGAFPHHTWELCPSEGRSPSAAAAAHWRPSSPLCRWEYLAADLAHTLFRHQQAQAAERHGALHGLPDGGSPAPWQAGEAAPQPEAIYARFDVAPDADETAGSAQMELFSIDAAVLRARLLRQTHRRHGPEGVALLAALCAVLHAAPQGARGAGAEFALAAVAAEAGPAGLTERGLRSRTAKLGRIVADLEQVELTRVFGTGAQARARTGRLLTVLGRCGAWTPGGAAGGAADGAADGAAGAAMSPEAGDLRLLADPLCLGDEGVCAAFRDLPPVLLACAGKAHPWALPLYVWLRDAWRHGEPDAVQRTARALLDEAGVWVSATGRYRAVEALKHDLEFMREQGWLGRWRMHRSDVRDALEDRYELHAPTAWAQGQAETGRRPDCPEALVPPAPLARPNAHGTQHGPAAAVALRPPDEEALTGT